MSRLSIVVAAHGLEGVYQFMPLVHADEAELVVVHAGSTCGTGISREVKLLGVEEDLSETEMRFRGVHQATGERIAVFGENYVSCESWADAASGVSADVACGCVHPPLRGSLVNWAIYLSEYSHLAPPMRRHTMTVDELRIIPDGNVVYRRDLAASASQPELRADLARNGRTFLFEPELAVRYEQIPGLEEYLHQRYYDSKRWAVRASRNRSVASRYWSAISRLALPVLLLFRRGRNVLSRKRYGAKFITSLPLLILFGVVEAAGEITGFLSGACE